jgi:membrane protein
MEKQPGMKEDRSVANLPGLVRGVAEKVQSDRIAAESARIAFYFFLSLFPFILVLFSLTGYFGREAAFHWVMGQLEATMPQAASHTVVEFVRQMTASPSAGALSISLLLILWSASNIFAALADGLNHAYRVERRHRWWKKRILSLLLMALTALALLGVSVVVLAGPEIATRLGLRQPARLLLRWPLIFALSVCLMWLSYLLLPNHDQSRAKRRILVGAVVGTTLWVSVTMLFRLYVANFDRFTVVYGVVGGVVILLVWFYLTAFSILVGGEVAAALERRSPKVQGRQANRPRSRQGIARRAPSPTP